MKRSIVAGLSLGLLTQTAVARDTAPPLRINDVAVIGTHNSYKQPMSAATMAKVRAVDPLRLQAASNRMAQTARLRHSTGHDPRNRHHDDGDA